MSAGMGAKIALDGASSFKKSLDLIKSSSAALKAEFANVISQFDKTDRSTEALSAQNNVLAKSLENAKSKVSMIESELKKQSAALAENEKDVKEKKAALDQLVNSEEKNTKAIVAAEKALASSSNKYLDQAKKVQNLEKDLNNAEKEVNDFTREIKDNEKAVESAKSDYDSAANEINDLGKSAESGGGKISAMTVALGNMISNAVISGLRKLGSALKDAILTGIEFNMQIKTYQASFTSLLQSQEKAVDMVEDLRSAFKGTVFNISDTAAAAQTLLGYGVTAENIIPVLKNLGDISLGNKDSFNSLALAFGQVQAKGKLAGEEVRQMVNAGFNPLQEIAKMTGETMEEVSARMSAGAISAEEVAAAFAHASGEGGLFYNAMENQSKTLSGQLATLKATIQESLGTALEGATEVLATEVIPKLIEFAESVDWEKLGDTIAKVFNFLIDNGDMIAAAIAGITAGFIAWKIATLATNIALLANPIVLIVTAIVAAIALIVMVVVKNWDWIKEKVSSIWSAITSFFTQIGEFIKKTWDAIINKTVEIWESIVAFVTETIPNMIKNIIDWFAELPGRILAWLKKIIDDVIQWGKDLASKALDAAKNMLNNIIDTIKSLPQKMLDIGRNLVEGIWNGIKNAASWLWGKITGWCQDIVDKIKNFFGINSPATLMRDAIGKFLPPGITVGFEKAMPSAIRNMKSSLGDAMDQLAEVTPTLVTNVENGIDSLPVSVASAGASNYVSLAPNITINVTAPVSGASDTFETEEISATLAEMIAEKLDVLTRQKLRAQGVLSNG